VEGLETRQLLSTFTVTLATDNGGPAGQRVTATTGDLRYCIEQADAAHSAATDTINFSPTVFAMPQTITLQPVFGPLVLSDGHPLTINGPAASTVTASGGSQVEVFDIGSGTVTLKNLAITNGNAALGAGIFNHGNLTLTNCILEQDSVGSSGAGGGLFNGGTANLTNCTLKLDSAGFGGAIANAIGRTVTLSNCNLSNDSAGTAGGGIFNYGGTVTLSNTTLGHDLASGATSGFDGGGAIFDFGTAVLTNCTLNNDSANSDGGGILIPSGGTATLTNCALSHDLASGGTSGTDGGGGIFDAGTAVLTNCTVNNNVANSDGGGIFIRCGGSATLTSCTIGSNLASDSGLAFGGGGVFNGGTATVANCTLSDNLALATLGGGLSNSSTAALTNCTIANNWAARGGGIFNVGTATLANCTIAGNSAVGSNIFPGHHIRGNGGGILNFNGTLNLTNSIVAENTADGLGQDIFSTFFSTTMADHDLIGNGDQSLIVGGNGNLVGTGSNPIDPRLGALQNNGGPTPTMALLPGSLAIGHADNAKAPATDQRGITRSDEFQEATDIGAFEF
jgi:hypothetical protein